MLTGSYTALVTPFDDNSVDYQGLGKLVDFQIESGISGILAVGTTGESPTLSWEEHNKVIEAVAEKTKNNEPRNALIFTAALIALALFFGNLDALASLITMFFLITYGMLNLVVFIQQSMQIISFRPSFKIPRFVSLLGAIGCGLIMVLINPIFSILAIIIIIILYIWLTIRT